jgi:hypothetical protein
MLLARYQSLAKQRSLELAPLTEVLSKDVEMVDGLLWDLSSWLLANK